MGKWKSEVDQQSGPIPAPMPPDRRIGYAVVRLRYLSLEGILPALNSYKKSKLTALVSGSLEKMKMVASQYGIKSENCYSYETYDRIKSNKEVDACVRASVKLMVAYRIQYQQERASL
ncbi:hypothetical protein [Dyadobacter frigoris]|uniref:Uncharacterized protein n=1 Tax=Dyadobacter frigoris TaxID=2576211 RepID=A0A4U6CQG1_9BACT|nr:hypothetical protein [Dyadobacter frigoris]TKT85681.1 hypothetical protein FDK13_33500 [Dyadobacter frigoris]